jgi:formylglycine-generating enzyme required for sulfatase activity
VRIPAGSFNMGSPDSDPEARDFEKPRHHATISKPFIAGRYEVM